MIWNKKKIIILVIFIVILIVLWWFWFPPLYSFFGIMPYIINFIDPFFPFLIIICIIIAIFGIIKRKFSIILGTIYLILIIILNFSANRNYFTIYDVITSNSVRRFVSMGVFSSEIGPESYILNFFEISALFIIFPLSCGCVYLLKEKESIIFGIVGCILKGFVLIYIEILSIVISCVMTTSIGYYLSLLSYILICGIILYLYLLRKRREYLKVLNNGQKN